MTSMLNAVADYLMQQSWQLFVVFGVVLAGSWGLRKASAHWRYLLWLVVIAKCLTPPVFNLPLAVLSQGTILSPSDTDTLATTYAAQPKISTITPRSTISNTSNRQSSIVTSLDMREPNLVGPYYFNLRQWLLLAWMSVVGMILAYVFGKML